jgi:uncharacterized protein with HEPN domain
LKSDKEYLAHILEEADFLTSQSNCTSFEALKDDPIMKRAFARSIEIIGEAVKLISPALKTKYPEMEWKKMAGARDRLIHGYFAIDYEIVWDIAVHKAPMLKNTITRILEKENFIL